MPGTHGLTYADLAAFPDDELRREILDGELIVTPSPCTDHQLTVVNLCFLFESHRRQHGGAVVFIAPMDVILSDTTVVEPDVFVILDADADRIGRNSIAGPPALVIEVLSDPRIDKVRKRGVYARHGVPEYWVADFDAHRIEVFRLKGDRYDEPVIYEAGDTIDVTCLSGLHVNVDDVFRQPR